MNLRDWTLRLRALLRPGRAERDLHDELAFHLERETRKLIDEGMSPSEARDAAQARFGSTTLAADECRDERGTAVIDNTVRDIQYALRTFKRAPLAALTIVVTVAIGLGVVAVLYTILNVMLFRLDTVPDITEIYTVARPQQAEARASRGSRVRVSKRCARKPSVFTDAYAALNEIDLRVDGRMMAVNLVSASFFDVVNVNPVMGRAFGLADDDRSGGNPVIVLSDKGWERHFKRAQDVIGRTVLVTGAPYEIIGVMPAGFRGLEVSAPDLWAPLSRLADFVPDYKGGVDTAGVEIVGRLKPGISMESARAQIGAWDANQSSAASQGRTLSIELLPRDGTIPQPWEAIAVFTPLFLAFGLILLIGCANVANLLLARGVARQREIGIRLSLGASRRRIVRQLITESVLLALAAAAGGYLISRIALETAVYWMLRSMPIDLGDVNLSVPAADWRVALFLVAAAAAATAFFALMPALQATRIDPVRTMRGELVKDARPGTRAQRADWRAGVRLGAAADLRRDLPAQRDRLVAIRSGFAYRRHGAARYRQRAQAWRDAPGDRRRAHHYRARAASGHRCWPCRRERLPTPAQARRRCPTSSSPPRISRCSASRSCAVARSRRRRSTTIPWRSCRNRSRAPSGRMAMASARRSGSSRISRPSRISEGSSRSIPTRGRSMKRR